MGLNDKNLLLRFVTDRDQAAFGQLVQQYIGLVFHSALRRVGDAHAAEDITQQVFTVLARKAAKVGTHESLVGWLHTTTRLEAHQFMRCERRRSAREKEALMLDDPHTRNPVRDWERLQPMIDEALDQLNTKDRNAVLMRFFNNQSFAAIGEQLGVTENAARMRVDRALDKLNGILSARKITSVSLAAALATEAVAASAPPALAAQVTAQAVAGAMLGAGGGLAATIFTMTTSSKIIVAAACALMAIGLGSAVYEGHLLTEARAQIAAVKRQLDTALAESGTHDARIAELEKELASAKRAQASAPKPALDPASRSPLRYSNPDYARLRLEQFRASLPGKYSSFYRTLNLSKAQIEAFEAIQVECQQELIDIWAAAELQGIASGSDNSASTSVARMTSKPLSLRDEKLKVLLGEENMNLYKDFDSPKGQTATKAVASLAGDLSTTPTPLTEAQSDQLRKAIIDHTEIVKEPMASDGGSKVYRLVSKTDWKAVNAKAGEFLSAEQRVVLGNRAAFEATDAQLKHMEITPAK